MKYFLLLVQEMEVKIPAPVCEVVAHAVAAAAAAPPLVLHRKIDSQSRCLMSKVFSLVQATLLHGILPTLTGNTYHASQRPHQHYQVKNYLSPTHFYHPCCSSSFALRLHSKCQTPNWDPDGNTTQRYQSFVGPVCLCDLQKL